MGPQIIILDEPTSGQDYQGLLSDYGYSQEEFNKRGHTLVVVTHHMALVAEYTERTIVMMNSEVLMDDSTREVFTHPDKLRMTHIKVPQITEVARELQPKIPINQTVLNVEEFGEKLIALKNEKGGKAVNAIDAHTH